jgi:hypothetical protein
LEGARYPNITGAIMDDFIDAAPGAQTYTCRFTPEEIAGFRQRSHTASCDLGLWDYDKKRPMPPDHMEKQCETGLQLLREQRIEGMIFLASCICDLNLEAVEWTREWIGRVGDRRL